MVVVLVAPAIAAAPLGGSREPLLVAVLVPPAVVLPGGRPGVVAVVVDAVAASGLTSGCRRLSRLSSPHVPRWSTNI